MYSQKHDDIQILVIAFNVILDVLKRALGIGRVTL